MIVSASYRTDIPAFYASWFQRRLEAGFARVHNPYGGGPYTVALDSDSVDGFVFWTRNVKPFGEALDNVAARGAPFILQFTATGYPRALETSVIDPAAAARQMHDVRDRHGERNVVWRYDPILLTSLTDAEWHVQNFARLASMVAGASDEVTVSFANIYRKTARNLDAAARAADFSWMDPTREEKRTLLTLLAPIARSHGMRLTICTQPDLVVTGASEARCIDADRLSEIARGPFKARLKGNRPGCGCHESRDIGDYDSCPHGCAYCYAVGSRERARRRYASHDPESPFLCDRTPTR